MGMVFCRGCGKEIHETAPTCPHCGATQNNKKVLAEQNTVRKKTNSPFDWYITALKKYTQFSGRADRQEFWWFTLFNTLISMILIALFLPVGLVYYWGSVLPAFAAGSRRLHDTGRSAWWILVPLANIIFLAEAGQEFENQYGESNS